jgi:hypothetical protein
MPGRGLPARLRLAALALTNRQATGDLGKETWSRRAAPITRLPIEASMPPPSGSSDTQVTPALYAAMRPDAVSATEPIPYCFTSRPRMEILQRVGMGASWLP